MSAVLAAYSGGAARAMAQSSGAANTQSRTQKEELCGKRFNEVFEPAKKGKFCDLINL